MFACEAKFHRKCLIDCMQTPEKWRSGDQVACEMQGSLVEAHQKAFDAVCLTVQTSVLEQNKVVKLSSLHHIYVSALSETAHSNHNYRSANLKAKLMKMFNDQIVFCEMSNSGKFQSPIIFSSALDVKTAVKQAFLLGSTDTIESVGITLRHMIAESY